MAPSEQLSFPKSPLAQHGDDTWYDVDGDGKADFALVKNDQGHVDRLLYDDDEDGDTDREYRLSDYSDDDVPHTVILLDSIPFQLMADRYAAGDFRFFGEPQKVIAAFPSLTEVCYTEVLNAPPLQTVIDTQYDPRLRDHRSDIWKRVVDHYEQPWERRLSYHASYAEQGLSFLDPQKWYAAELSRCKRAIDDSPRQTTIVYTASAASLVCKEGRAGANEVLDGAQQLCLQLLYEHHGAINISLMADHGHNFVESHNVDLAALLTADGFHVTNNVKSPDDVVISMNGLVTNALLQTARPARVAAALVKHEPIELAMSLEGDRVIVRGKAGVAAIEVNGINGFRYTPIDGDVLGYQLVMAAMKSKKTMNANGFAGEREWLAATIDHEWPDAPARIWNAFHRQTVMPPGIMLSFKDGFYCGKPEYERFITMKSTHGGLNQINSATFVMTMRNALFVPLPERDIMGLLCPDAPPQPIEPQGAR